MSVSPSSEVFWDGVDGMGATTGALVGGVVDSGTSPQQGLQFDRQSILGHLASPLGHCPGNPAWEKQNVPPWQQWEQQKVLWLEGW